MHITLHHAIRRILIEELVSGRPFAEAQKEGLARSKKLR
jgi:hypothetical protein